MYTESVFYERGTILCTVLTLLRNI